MQFNGKKDEKNQKYKVENEMIFFFNKLNKEKTRPQVQLNCFSDL